jgi:hypothetical protein
MGTASAYAPSLGDKNHEGAVFFGGRGSNEAMTQNLKDKER